MTERQSTAGAEQKPSSRWMPWVLAAVAVFVLSFQLGSRELSSPDETRYSAIAWSMGTTGDWLTPTHNVKFKHWHKPPLTYWLMASSFAVLGQNDWAARLPSACAALAAVLGAYVIGRTLHGARAGFLSGLILLASPLFFALARLANTDMLLCAFVTWTWVCFVRSVFGEKRRHGWFVLGGVFAGLGFMTKGPVVLVATLAPMLLTMLLTNQWRRVGWWPWLAATGACLVVGLPWYLVVCIKNPGLLKYFVEYQTLQRVATEVHGRGAPFLFFFLWVPLGFLPWVALPVFEVFASLRRGDDASAERRRMLAPVCWFAVVFVVISVSGSKLITYCLPLFPALALLAGRFVERAFDRTMPRRLIAFGVACSSAVLFAVTAILAVGDFAADQPTWVIGVGGAVAALAGLGGLLVGLLHRARAAFGVVLVGVMIVLLGVSWAVPYAQDALYMSNAGRELAGLIEERKAPPAEGVEIRVAMFRRYLKELPYYLDGAVLCLDCDIELSYAAADGEEVSLYTDEELHELHEGYSRRHGLMWLNRWMRQPDRRWLVVTDRDSFGEIRPMLVTSTGLPLVVEIAEVGEFVLFSNFRDGEAVNVLTAAGRDAESGNGGDD